MNLSALNGLNRLNGIILGIIMIEGISGLIGRLLSNIEGLILGASGGTPATNGSLSDLSSIIIGISGLEGRSLSIVANNLIMSLAGGLIINSHGILNSAINGSLYLALSGNIIGIL